MQLNYRLNWETGGLINNSATNKTEYYSYDGSRNEMKFNDGPDLPNYSANHCIIKLKDNNDQSIHYPNDTSFAITGGSLTNSTTTFVEVTRFAQIKFHRGPKLLTGRSNHVCGTFILHGKTMLIVSGGNGEADKTTEILDLTSNKGWVKGKHGNHYS